MSSRKRSGTDSLRGVGCESLENRRMMTGTWTTVASPVPSGDAAQYGVVLTDGSIMVHGVNQGAGSNAWYKLTPSASGSYVNGSWSTLHPSNLSRLYTATEVLQSGKVLIVGGEYSGSPGTNTDTNTGEIYDPVANSWTNITNFPNNSFGDDPSALLPNGQVLTGYISGPQTYIYNPAANTWTQTGTKLLGDPSDEESWVTLPDHSILTYDVFTSTPHAQRYIPATGTWVDAGIPVASLSSSSVGFELGPGLLLPDGRVFFGGGNNNTAYYTPSTNSWTAGPAFPTVSGTPYVMADAPGAVLPDGNLLLAMSPLGTELSSGYNFPPPTRIFELNPTTNVYTDVTPSTSVFNTTIFGSYTYTFLVLPTGQIAVFNDFGTVGIYTESGSPVAAATPVITNISYAGTTGVYTLSGTNLNGINDGAAYGDDNEMASNYPLVRLTDSSGNVTYARTTNWSLTGVSQGAETVTFTLPVTDTTGAYLIQSVANGVPSATALAVLVNANTTTNVTIQADANPADVDVLAGGTTIATYVIANFNSIYFVGDNAGDTLSVNLNINTSGIITTVQAGSGTDTINVNQTPSNGPVVINPSAGNDAVNVGTVGAGTAVAQFLAAQQIGVLTIGNGGKATVTNTGAKKLLQANGVVTSGTGLLDLTNNDMIIHGGNLATLNSEIASGFNGSGGNVWTGPGITSSTAATNPNHLTALGIILNNNLGGLIYGAGTAMGTFDGQSPALGDVLIKYTYFGDANLDGHVDGTDYANTDNGFLFQLTGWFNGAFNYNGVVNGSDYTLIDAAFNTQGATIAAQVAAQIVQPSAIVTKAPGNFAVFVPQYQDGSFNSDEKRPKPVSELLVTADPLEATS